MKIDLNFQAIEEDFSTTISETEEASFVSDFGHLQMINGKDGKDGKDGYTPVKGVDYFDGKDGEDGYTPIKGVDYFDGKDGVNGKDGRDGVNGTNGVDGKDGEDGEDGIGISSIVKTKTSGLVDTYTITYTNNTKSTFTVTNGAKGDQGIQGEKGDAGKDGTNGKDGVNGTNGQDGYTPIRGTDYWTASDKAEIVSDVIALLPIYNGEVEDV